MRLIRLTISRTRIRKPHLATVAFALLVPALLSAHKNGPQPAANGDPDSSRLACAQTDCHIGTALNGGGGSIAVTSSSGGATYVPGVKQTFTLTIRDSSPSVKLYGFQASIRVQGSSVQAGSFTPVPSSNTFVQCSDGRFRPTAGCPAIVPIEYIQHGPNPTSNRNGVFTFDWTPPASAVGPIVLYFAGNASNGNDDADSGDHIYDGTLTLTATATVAKPVITGAGSAGAYGALTTITGGTWIEIFGSNLATTDRQWTGNDFNGSVAPTLLDGVSVTVNGKPAYVWFLASGATGQLNVQAPTDGAISGDAKIVVTVNGQSSDPFTLAENSTISAGLLAPGTYKVGNKQYVVALFGDGATYACPPNSFAGITCKLPKPGDLLTFYGIGFGETVNSIPAGFIAPVDSKLLAQVNWQYGSTNATVQFGGLAPGAVGLYQFNVVTPQVPPGEYLLSVRIGGVAVSQILNLQIGQ